MERASFMYSKGVPMDHIKRITWDLTAFCNLNVHRGFLDAAGMIYVCEARHLCSLLKLNAIFPELRGHCGSVT